MQTNYKTDILLKSLHDKFTLLERKTSLLLSIVAKMTTDVNRAYRSCWCSLFVCFFFSIATILAK